MKIAINGLGRIGRMVMRALYEMQPKGIDVVAFNDLGAIQDNVHLLKYDSVHGRFPGDIKIDRDYVEIGPWKIKALREANPAKLPWKEMGVDLVLECSGRFTDRHDAAKHLEAGAERVLISAPGKDADITVVYGVNHNKISSEHKVLSNASCTTNCLAPMAYVLNQGVGIERGYMTTIHSYTGDQRLVDTYHSDLRRARAAALSMIPTSTGAAKAVGLVLPELKGKLDGTAIRVPTPNVSVVDFKFVPKRKTTVDEINQLMRTAAAGALKGVLSVVDEPLVSIDFNHSSFSSNFDAPQTQVIDGEFCRVLSWYDNEWGFSCRMVDVVAHMAPRD